MSICYGGIIMNRKKLVKLSIASFGISAFILTFNYFFYHYFTSKGFTSEFHKEPQKPFVSDLIGQLGVLFLFLSITSLLIAFICYEKKENNKK